MVKYRIKSQWYDREDNPRGDPNVAIIDPRIDRAYDGAKCLGDIERTFLDRAPRSCAHHIGLRVKSIEVIDE